MKKTYTLGATVVAGLMALALSAQAASPSFPIVAKFYSSWFARAMDECTAPDVVSVFGANLPGGGCVRTNLVTDSSETLKWAKLLVTSRGKVVLIGTGLVPGSRTLLQLKLRFTVQNVHVMPPALPASQTITFVDQTVLCPSPAKKPFGFTAGRTGTLVSAALLTDCLDYVGHKDLQKPPSNIEILGASLLNRDNSNKVFAEVGVVR